jgi:hypothetical protein
MSDTSRKIAWAAALAGGFVLAEVKKAVRQYFRPVTAAFEHTPERAPAKPDLKASHR